MFPQPPSPANQARKSPSSLHVILAIGVAALVVIAVAVVVIGVFTLNSAHRDSQLVMPHVTCTPVPPTSVPDGQPTQNDPIDTHDPACPSGEDSVR